MNTTNLAKITTVSTFVSKYTIRIMRFANRIIWFLLYRIF